MVGIITYVEQKWYSINKDSISAVSQQRDEEWWLVDVDGKNPI